MRCTAMKSTPVFLWRKQEFSSQAKDSKYRGLLERRLYNIASVGYKIFLFSAFLLTIFSWSVKKGEVQRKFSLHWLYKNVDITNVIVLHVSWLRNEWGNRKKIIHNRTFGLSSWNNIVLEGELTGARITLLIIQYLNLTSKCVQLFHDGSRLST